MPKLNGRDLSPGAGISRQRVVAGEDEIVLGCPLVRPCEWRTVRPLHAAHSAQEAHLIAHEKGLIP